jgi:SAM-dependent methyltransferase
VRARYGQLHLTFDLASDGISDTPVTSGVSRGYEQPRAGGTRAGLCQGEGMADYREINRANWDDRAPAHAASPNYAVPQFVTDPGFLSGVVRFDRPLLGDVSDLRGVHLQCHIGTDTVSLSRLGATMTGLDFSPAALAQARDLAARADADVTFVQADVYDAAEVLGFGGFDLVYTGIGALNWLPSIDRWARTVAALLRPGGRLFIREGHPMLWSVADPRPDGLIVVEYPYFERDEPQVWDEPGTYVQTDASFAHTTTHEWNHGLGQILTALMDADMTITGLTEHDSVPWDALPGMMTEIGGGEYRLADRPWRLAHSYTLQAVRRA